MKKLFYIFASAIVALGAVACQNEIEEGIDTNTNVESLSFTADIDETTRVAFDENGKTVWAAGDIIEVICGENTYEFTNTAEEVNTFTCTQTGVTGIVGQEVMAIYSYEQCQNLESSKGIAGSHLVAEGVFPEAEQGEALIFRLQNALLYFTATTDVTFTSSVAIFVVDNVEKNELTVAASEEKQYVAINGATTDFSYSANGVLIKSLTGFTFNVGMKYNLGTLDGVRITAVDKLNEQIAEGATTITLTEDVVFEEGDVLTIPAGKEVTIDLGGKTMTAVSQATTKTDNMIENKGNLTLTNGTIDYADVTVMTADPGYASNTIYNANGATLTIEEGVTIINNSGASVANYGYPHCIDNAGTLVINGGTFTNNANYSAMRIWCSKDDDTNVTINGGTFNGCIDFHNPDGNANKGTLTINGGTFNGDGFTNAAVRLLGFGTDVDEMVSTITGGTFNKQIKISNYTGGEMNAQVFFVSGGKFNVEPTGFLAENCVTYVDGEYYVAAPMADAMQVASEIRVSNEIDLAKVSLNGYTGAITGVGEAAALSTRNYTVAANANEFYNIQNSTITFQNIDLLFPTADIDFLQTGIVGKSSTFTLDNCYIEGQFTLNGNATWNFNECDFVSTEEGAYCSFVYGATKATFTECDFKGVDRAAKVYGTGGNIDVVYDNCTFTSTTTNKAAINIDANYATTTVAINGCSQTNMNDLYAVVGTKATVTIDGVMIGAVAMVNSTYYKTIEEAIAAANGDVVTLLADAKVSKACVINANTHTLTTGEGFLALKNYANDKGYYDVVATEAQTKFTIAGSFNSWGAATAMVKIKGTNVMVAKGVELEANTTMLFLEDGSYDYARGAKNETATLNTLEAVGSNDIKVTTAGTYDIYYLGGGYVILADGKVLPNVHFEAASASFYLKPNKDWLGGGARFAAYFCNGSSAAKWVNMTDSDYDGLWEVTTPNGENHKHIIFCRKNGANNTNGWDGNQWNQTADLTISGNTGNVYKITGWDKSGAWIAK